MAELTTILILDSPLANDPLHESVAINIIGQTNFFSKIYPPRQLTTMEIKTVELESGGGEQVLDTEGTWAMLGS